MVLLTVPTLCGVWCFMFEDDEEQKILTNTRFASTLTYWKIEKENQLKKKKIESTERLFVYLTISNCTIFNDLR